MRLNMTWVAIAVVVMLLVAPGKANSTSVAMMSYEQCVTVYGGSGTCTDRAMAYYGALGYTGTIYDREMAYLGALGYTGTWLDRWYAYLGSRGMTGGFTERFAGSWTLVGGWVDTQGFLWADDDSFNWNDG